MTLPEAVAIAETQAPARGQCVNRKSWRSFDREWINSAGRSLSMLDVLADDWFACDAQGRAEAKEAATVREDVANVDCAGQNRANKIGRS